MKTCLSAAIALLLLGFAAASASGQNQQAPAAATSGAAGQTSQPQASQPEDAQRRADAYYNFAMGHLAQQEFETSNKSDDANRAIDFYKKAYALDPSSQEIGEKLAEIYFLAQRTRDAVDEIQGMLSRDPSNLPARRLLARIYLRALGDLSNATEQDHTLALATEQLTEIVRLDPSDSDSAIWLARIDRLTNKRDEAEKVLRSVLERDPQNENAIQQTTELLLDENRSAEAISLLEASLKEEPTPGLYDQLGDAYTQMRDPSHAANAYRQAAALEPDEPGHLQGLAQSLSDMGDLQGAADQYQKLVGMQPNDANNYLHLSTAYRRLNQLDKAEQQALLAKQHAPGNLEVIYNEALIYQDEARYDDAVRVLADAVAATKSQTEITPSRRRTLAVLYQLLGEVYGQADKTASAVSSLQEMAKLGPEEDQRARWLIIDAYRMARDLPHAFDEASQAVKDYPNDRSLRISQALLYGENSQSDQATQLLQPLLNNSETDLEVYLDLAQVYEENRRFEDAEKTLHTAEGIATRPEDKESIGFLFGAVYERQKKYDQAEEAFKGVLAIDPHNAQTLNYYGYMLADRGVRLDEAHGLIQRALSEDPTNAAYLDSIGWAEYRQNNLADAEANLRKALSREPHSPTLMSHLGDILAKSGKTDLAVAEWQMSLAEWRRVVPSEFEADQVSQLEQRIAAAKPSAPQQKRPAAAKP